MKQNLKWYITHVPDEMFGTRVLTLKIAFEDKETAKQEAKALIEHVAHDIKKYGGTILSVASIHSIRVMCSNFEPPFWSGIDALAYQYSRAWYMEPEVSSGRHRTYYGQFVNDNVRHIVKASIGLKSLLKSDDIHFNDIPLKQWDDLDLFWNAGFQTPARSAALWACGEKWSLNTNICIAKEAARQIVERHNKRNENE